MLERTLTTPGLKALLQELPTLEPSGRHRRTALVLPLLVAAARRDHLEQFSPSAQDDGGWLLHVVGKRGRHRTVPLLDDLVQELSSYLAARGLPGKLDRVPSGTYLIGKVEDLHLKVPGAARVDVVDATGAVETMTTLPDGAG